MAVTPPSARTTALATVIGGHVAAVAVFALGGTVQLAARPAAAITVHEVPAKPVETVAPAVTLAAVPVDVAAPSVEVADDTPGPAGDCAVIDRLTTALAGDRAVGRALAALPPERTSMANAVMAWDGRWAEALAPVRRVVFAALSASPAACRAAEVAGPRLLIIPGERPVALAFGSGRWRWDDVLADGRDASNSKT